MGASEIEVIRPFTGSECSLDPSKLDDKPSSRPQMTQIQSGSQSICSDLDFIGVEVSVICGPCLLTQDVTLHKPWGVKDVLDQGALSRIQLLKTIDPLRSRS